MSWSPLRFDQAVTPGGYAWWYVDAVSDDRSRGATLIMFIGSVFSSRYAAARRRDRATAAAERFCAVNLAVYELRGRGPSHRCWVMNEHARVERDATHLRVGSSSIGWRGETLEIEVDERETKFFGRPGVPLRGRIRLRPATRFDTRIELDRWRARPRHRWYPVAPHARVELEFDAPGLSFAGSGYHDVNEGDEALEQGFRSWNWSRCDLQDATVICYDVVDAEQREHARAWRFSPNRGVEDIAESELGPPRALPPTRWGVARAIRCDPGHTPKLRRTLEDTPFYSRNLVEVHVDGKQGEAMHESISLRRFDRSWVRFLLPFKTTTWP